MKITKIITQTKNPNRVNVFVDGEFLTGAEKLYIVGQRIKVGEELSVAESRNLSQKDTQHKAYSKALKLLALRPQSTREMVQKLGRRFDDQLIKQTIVRLTQDGLLDDYKFTMMWVNERLITRQRSIVHLRSELIAKGIARSIIDEVLSAPTVADNQLEMAQVLAKKHWRSNQAEDFRKTKAYLARRGYPYAVIKVAMDALLADAE